MRALGSTVLEEAFRIGVVGRNKLLAELTAERKRVCVLVRGDEKRSFHICLFVCLFLLRGNRFGRRRKELVGREKRRWQIGG